MDYFITPAQEELLNQSKQVRIENMKTHADFMEVLEQFDETEIKEVMNAYNKSDHCELGRLLYRSIDNLLDTQAIEDLEDILS